MLKTFLRKHSFAVFALTAQFFQANKKDRLTKKLILLKAVSFLLMVCLLTTSTPAAPPIIVGMAGEMSQNIRFGFLSRGWAIDFPGWFGGAFLTTLSSSTKSKMARVQIFPGSITVTEGEQVNFSAVGFDRNNEPVSGIKSNWTSADKDRGFAPRVFQSGLFEAAYPGTFIVTVEAGGFQDQVTVTVEASDVPTAKELGSQSTPTKRISSLDNNPEKEASSKDGEVQNAVPDGGWNDGNWGSGDDPGNTTGNPPGTPADDGAGSGNFQISAPVISLPGRGLDLALSANYNSRLWNKSVNELTYDIDRGFPAPGWSLGFGKIMDLGTNGGSMLIDADGTRHGFAGTVTGTTYSTFIGHTADGKFIDYTSSRDPSGINSGSAQFPNGTKIIYGAKGNQAVYPIQITDAQGNYITVTYRGNVGPAIETVTDTMGRVITFNYDTLGRLINITAPRMQGEDPIYGNATTRVLLRLHYRSLPLNYSFGAGITPVVRNSTPDVIDSIYYPATNTGYWFGGSAPEAGFYSSYGMLAKVSEQRGMSWAAGSEPQGVINAGQMSKQALYNYPLTTLNEPGRTNGIGLTDAPTYQKLNESWDGMDVVETPETSYLFENNVFHSDGTSNSPARSVIITQPNGTISKQYSYRTPGAWTDGLVFADETVVMNGTTPTIVSSSLVSWQQGTYDSPRPSWAEITDENGKKVKTIYEYTGGNFNQVTRSCDYNDGGTKLRCAVAQYENGTAYIGTSSSYGYVGRHIFNLLKATGVENADGTKASWTEYEYDNYQTQPLANTPYVIQHLASHDPYSTATKPCNCHWSCDLTAHASVIPNCPDGSPPDWVCDQCPVYEPATNYRGNITKTTSYSDANNLTSGAIVETKGYDETGNLITASSPNSQQTSFQYSVATQFAYPESQTRGSAVSNSPDRVTTYSVYNFATGLPKQTTDANGRISVTNYNPDTLRPVKSISSTGAYTLNSYDDTAMSFASETRDVNNVLATKNIKYLNGLGDVRKEESVGPNSISDFVEVKYNKLGEVWKESRPYQVGETPQYSETFYDQQGRVTQVTEADGSTTQAFYNETQRPDSASTEIGTTTRVVDAWGRERWGRYDQQRRLVEVVEPNPTGNGSVMVAGSLMTKYSQDTLGQLIKTEQGTQIREFKYDSLGRLTRQKLAEQTATLNDNGTFVGENAAGAKWSESFVYDSRSNVVQKTDPRGIRSNYSYLKPDNSEDPLNRLQSVNYDMSGPLAPNYNILGAPGVSYEYMTTGDKLRIKKIRTAGILTEDYAYDTEGRLSDLTETIDYRTGYPMTTSYLYDSLDRTTDVRYPAQYGLAGSPRKLIQQTYDTASRLTALNVDGLQNAGNITYNAADQTTSIKIGTAGLNQVTENYTYDAQNGLLTNQSVRKGRAYLLDLSYDYARNNSAGNLNGKTGHLTKITNNLDANKNREYEYDTVGRLTKAKGGVNSLWTQQYSYDRYGNRTNVVSTGVAANGSTIPRDGIPNLTYNTGSNRISTAGYQYDVAGNQTRALAEDGVTWLIYEYDSANRLQIIKKESDGTYLQAFQFGSSNQRLMDLDYVYGYVKMFGNGGAVEYTEFNSTVMTWSKSYVYLGDALLSTITPNGSGGEVKEFNHPDRLGTRLTTNQQTGATFEQTTLPFGTALNAETSRGESKRFTSYERSARTGLDYAVNRTYDSKLGRFTQVDPIGMSATNLVAPQTLNLYNYCGNDPINHTDPDGLFWGAIGRFFKSIFKWIAVAVSVALAVVAIILAPAFSAFTLKIALTLIGVVLSAASTVLNALGYTKAAAIFGIVAAFATFGGSLITVADKFNLKNLFAAISAGASAVSATLNALGYTKLSQIFGLASSIAGFISGGFKEQKDALGKPTGFFKFQPTKFEIYKIVRESAQRVATITGATRLAGYLNILGIVTAIGENAVGLYKSRAEIKGAFEKIWHKGINVFGGLSASQLDGALKKIRTQVGRVNTIIRNVERGIALAR